MNSKSALMAGNSRYLFVSHVYMPGAPIMRSQLGLEACPDLR